MFRLNYFRFRKRKRSGKIAHDRLKILLVSDRAGCTPETMELIKNDILNVISKYVEKLMGLGSKEEYNPNTSISEEFLRENGFF